MINIVFDWRAGQTIFLLVLCLTGGPLKQIFILIIIFFINDMFNGNMTQNNFYAILILIRIKIYKKILN